MQFKVGDKVKAKVDGRWYPYEYTVVDKHPNGHSKKGRLIGVRYDCSGKYAGWINLNHPDTVYELIKPAKKKGLCAFLDKVTKEYS